LEASKAREKESISTLYPSHSSRHAKLMNDLPEIEFTSRSDIQFLCSVFEFRCSTSIIQHRHTLYTLIPFTVTVEHIYCVMQYINLQKSFFDMLSSSSLSRQPASDPGHFKISPPGIRPLLVFPILLHSAAKKESFWIWSSRPNLMFNNLT